MCQALKYECYLDSSLVRFLLRRAIEDIRVAHYLFWWVPPPGNVNINIFFLSDSKTWSLQIQEQEHISFLHPNLLVLRLLKDNLQDSQFSARYQHMLAALLCCVGGGLREEFDRQGWLVSILTNVAHKVRDAAPSSRQVGRNHGLMMSFRFAFRRSHPLKASVAVCPQRKSGWNEAVLLHQQQL